ncbi:DUF5703 domain-containing protein [Polaribacter atrinae]|uniref:Uncharacterized protein n=1 Tax=Polaribacter atrinae TaxID=1333662 RepID=A0A176TF00_9FLAO|nr:DUF5703 domain-containing protein [Polaribacter atrinae]OAD46452.1 hypothetical protein LPB303_02670 [Polaribacter atrinae]
MKNTICHYLLIGIALILGLAQCQQSNVHSNISNTDVVWETPSENSLGAMPAGNGDIGISLWVEKNGDLLFYVSKTDAWSENGRLLKLNKIRLTLSPNPFKVGNTFLQKLVVKDGLIFIEGGAKEDKTSINVWVDANHPVIELDIKSLKPISAKITTEPWRVNKRVITNTTELHSAYGIHGKGASKVIVEKDSILNSIDNNLVWLHRNNRSIWKENLKLQGLEEYTKNAIDPILHNTFGGLVRSNQLVKTSPTTLKTTNPVNNISASVHILTLNSSTEEKWLTQINQNANSIELKSRKDRLKNHKNWWQSFWKQSYIHVSTQNESEKERVFNISRGYNLQRYMNACSGRGNSPIKFNGSIFTVDTEDLVGEFQGLNADYRRWGGAYWWQNTRLPYWSMLESGDFELMKPLFKMYKDALPIRKFATKTYYNHEGAFFPETMFFWGNYVDANYGRDRSKLPLGMTENLFIRYYWQGGLEVSLMMLDYYSFTKDEDFLNETLLPVVTEIIHFFDKHWERDENGKILFDPAMALETYNKAINPLPEIVGIHKVCSELLKLPTSSTSSLQKKQWQRLISELPEIPLGEVDGKKVLAPAHEYSGKQNVENPELYAIFPYRVYGMGKPDLELARRTFEKRAVKGTGGWQQNAIKAAILGLTEEASKLTSTNFNTKNNAYRFPTMWGPNFDWTPDQDHGSVALIALQRMLLQYDEDQILLFPAWPKDWDVDFKLFSPDNTTIEASFKNGKIENLNVNPKSKKQNIKIITSTSE